MDIPSAALAAYTGQTAGASQAPQGAGQEEQRFRQALKELDAYLESQRKTPAQKRQEEAAAQQKRIKAKKVADLQLRLSALRSRVNMGYEDAERELSAVQNQLFLLNLFG